MPAAQRYSTDLTDAEWAMLERLIPKAKSGGRPEEYAKREIVNGIRYVLRTGWQWRLVPSDVPPWGSVYHYVRKWRLDGTWERIHDRFRADVRERAGRQRQPSAAILDSQSVKTTEKGGLAVTTQGKR
jgi:transposase